MDDIYLKVKKGRKRTKKAREKTVRAKRAKHEIVNIVYLLKRTRNNVDGTCT